MINGLDGLDIFKTWNYVRNDYEQKYDKQVMSDQFFDHSSAINKNPVSNQSYNSVLMTTAVLFIGFGYMKAFANWFSYLLLKLFLH